MNDETLLRLADANLGEFQREHARWLPPSTIQEDTDLLLTAPGTSAPGPWNNVLALGPRTPPAELVLERARRFFEPLQRWYWITTRAHQDGELHAACTRAGLELAGVEPGMVLVTPPAPGALASGVAIEQVTSAEQAASFSDVMGEAYEDLQLPAAVARKLFSRPERWLSPHCEAFLLRQQERALAGAMLLFSHGIAGVYWVGTRREARGRGYADAVTRFVSHRALAAGARAVVLQASPAGAPIYLRMGYREITRYSHFNVPVSAPGR